LAPRKKRELRNGEWFIECRGLSNHNDLVHESEFIINHINDKGEKILKNICKKCDRLKNRNDNEQDFIRYKVREATKNSKKRKGLAAKVDPDLYEQVLELVEQSGGLCAITNEPMLLVIGDDRSLSIDRKNHKLGYVRGNIQLVQDRMNFAKGMIEGAISRVMSSTHSKDLDLSRILQNIIHMILPKKEEAQTSAKVINSHGIDLTKDFFILTVPAEKFTIKQRLGRIYR
jgi:hypothetical protein